MSRVIDEAGKKDLGGLKSTTRKKESKISMANEIFNKVDLIDKMSEKKNIAPT